MLLLACRMPFERRWNSVKPRRGIVSERLFLRRSNCLGRRRRGAASVYSSYPFTDVPPRPYSPIESPLLFIRLNWTLIRLFRFLLMGIKRDRWKEILSAERCRRGEQRNPVWNRTANSVARQPRGNMIIRMKNSRFSEALYWIFQTSILRRKAEIKHCRCVIRRESLSSWNLALLNELLLGSSNTTLTRLIEPF